MCRSKRGIEIPHLSMRSPSKASFASLLRPETSSQTYGALDLLAAGSPELSLRFAELLASFPTCPLMMSISKRLAQILNHCWWQRLTESVNWCSKEHLVQDPCRDPARIIRAEKAVQPVLDRCASKNASIRQPIQLHASTKTVAAAFPRRPKRLMRIICLALKHH